MEFKSALYIVATPIGNLEDITYRAIEVLNTVQFVLAEDTRVSRILFNKYDISTQLISYRDQNHEKILPKVMEKLDLGLSLALISDSGTPLISDPGFKLVRELKLKGYEVITIPGPSAVVSALSISGLPTDKFTFLGFLPKSDSKRSKLIEEHSAQDCSVVIYESPNRILKLLEIIYEVCGPDRSVSVSRNLTKLSEECLTDTVANILSVFESRDSTKGEYVVIIGK
jgi:16S rRNA (cytidine1402-2'-O)-methyltransferase